MNYAPARSHRVDFLRAMDEDAPADAAALYGRHHNVWETSPWMAVAGPQLVQRADGRYRIVPEAELRADDRVLPNILRPYRVPVKIEACLTRGDNGLDCG